ncbi:hypothetical protein K469DRAFT_723884 [Zopfia rhizophila CBS 207.26]|uniref:Distal membrane-arm assembly complex protein 1-like domain-containing protein n=1 Tax=Zopfia rhizophila CBS 207.26 TaxID=1314779 RepID=A0A6A6D859_9PEZI|nr:hypothetical protein K469DRAFT_723884 [Zopfia rhizophila CBS 207.26]
MAKDQILPGPPPAPTFKEAIKEDKAQYDDCTPCRLMGSAVFIGLGAYTYISGRSQLRQQEAAILKSKSIFGMRSRKAGISGMAATFVGLGIYRWFA